MSTNQLLTDNFRTPSPSSFATPSTPTSSRNTTSTSGSHDRTRPLSHRSQSAPPAGLHGRDTTNRTELNLNMAFFHFLEPRHLAGHDIFFFTFSFLIKSSRHTKFGFTLRSMDGSCDRWMTAEIWGLSFFSFLQFPFFGNNGEAALAEH